jgi:hypothetical protein|tara:strand:- start:3534 stop:3815 length:282 start_codon:yes stop_codon:yes gene_type:complete
MSVDKVQDMQDFLKNQENFLIKEEAEAALQAEADARGSWNENPEEDGFWIAPDRSVVEIFYNMGQMGDENDDPIRGARGKPEVGEWANDDQTP